MMHDFASASHAVVHTLRSHFGFDLWMVTRTQGNDWIVLAVEDSHYGTKEGAVFKWSDSFCSRMVEGLGPRVAPQSDQISVYANAPIASALEIKAYVGVPITRADGSLFGTLCAIDPSPQADTIRDGQDVIELMAAMLSSLLNAELAVADATRRAERAEMEAAHDALTLLHNRRSWDQLLSLEEDRCRRYGHPACVISIDLDNLKETNDNQGHEAGDRLLVTTSQIIRNIIRAHDIAARIGGDEFFILCIECNIADAQLVVERLRHMLQAVGVHASIGLASRNPELGLRSACAEADSKMYEEKRLRQNSTD
tara:strand:+ start:696968 stop:697900 length:933 start_codon:yes stop_codon:yes gene_type:complete